jgi:hypothetical protein
MDTVLMLVTLASLSVAVVMSVVAWRVVRDERARADARVAALATELALASTSQAVDDPLPSLESPLFATAAEQGERGRRLAPALALGALALSAIVGALVLSGGAGDASSAASGPLPIELLSLRHTQQDGMTTITGLVRNPREGTSIERLTAVVLFFDGAGSFLTSARAPLEFTRLAAGEESPFHVSVPTPPGVSRYRVSFRQADSGSIAHVDRRGRLP